MNDTDAELLASLFIVCVLILGIIVAGVLIFIIEFLIK